MVMNMNLVSLFEMQKVLDYRIEQEHPRQSSENRTTKKILALQVELSELANELPEVFKFWSNKKNNYKKALGEYVDCLHFIISIGLELKVHYKNLDKVMSFNVYKGRGLEDKFLYVNRKLLNLYQNIRDEDGSLNHPYWVYLFEQFVGLGQMLGFSWEEIEQAYIKKNEVNHDRQTNKY